MRNSLENLKFSTYCS